MSNLVVKGFIETSFLDWDGHVVSSIYLPYCNFKCPFCHNSGLVEKSHEFETIPLEKIEQFLTEHKDFIDGVCITGGEPCLHKDSGLFDFMKKIRSMGFKIKLDTNGYDPEALLESIQSGLVDYIAMDIKGPLDERYDKLSGVKTDINKVKESIKIIMNAKIPYEFRTTIVPSLLSDDDIEDMARYIKGASKFVLQQFVPKNSWDETLKNVKPHLKEKFSELKQRIHPLVKNVIIRGI